MTLKELVKQCGSQEKTAHLLGVSFVTVNSWLRGHRNPSPLAVKNMAHHGVEWVGEE